MSDGRLVQLAERCAHIQAGATPDAVWQALLDEASRAVELRQIGIADGDGRPLAGQPGRAAQSPLAIIVPIARADGQKLGYLTVDPRDGGTVDATSRAILQQMALAAAAGLELCELRQYQRQTMAEVEEASARARHFIDGIAGVFLGIDRQRRVTGANAAAERLLGRAAIELVGLTVDEALPEDILPGLADAAARCLDADRTRALLVQNAPHDVWLEARLQPHRLGLSIWLTDIGDRAHRDVELRQIRAELHTVMETVPAVVWVAHDAAASRITGSRFAAELLRLAPTDNQSLSGPPGERPTHYRILRNDEEVAPAQLPLQRAARGEVVRNEELRVVFDDGSYFDELVSASPVLDVRGHPAGAVGTSMIITELKQAEAKAHQLAHQDPLTGLPNRLLFRRMLAKECQRVAREGGQLALLLLDLDHFKQVNDTLGHLAGDDLLVEMSRRLQHAVRRSDHVARLGGDEFAVLSGTAHGHDDVAILAQRLVQALSQPCHIRGAEVQCGVSIGLTVFPEDSSDTDGLLANADLALYAAKEAGRGRWRMFDPSLQEHARACRQLDHDLRRALEKREFELYYQPIVDIDTLQVVELEALLRWNDPARGLLGPADFLPYVERSRLLLTVTDWVIEAALRDAAAWRRAIPLALNMPGIVLDNERLVDRIAGTLAAAALSPGMLTIEVTEAAMAGSQAIASLETLRRRGARIAVDDFGAGYSSLSRLRDLPIDQIKLDRLFLGSDTPTTQDRAILRGVVTLATALGVSVVAEGVERHEQLALLREVGCGRAQGYLFARPMPAGRVLRWLDAWPARPAGTAGDVALLSRAPSRFAGLGS